MIRRLLVPALAAAFAFALAACGPPPVSSRKVDLTANDLRYSATLRGATGEEDYDFQVSGTKGWVSFSGTKLTAGTAGVVVDGGAGAELYRKQAGAGSPPADAATAVGQAGKWHLRLRFANATGPFALRITGVR